MKAQGLYDPRFEHDSCGVGFVCDVKGRKSNQIIRQSLEVLRRLSHRGATGADPKTGDGAGLLIQIPHDFFLKVCRENKIDLPAEGEYGVGLVFLPRDEKERKFCKNVFARIIRDEKQILLGWRSVPVDGSNIGKIAQDTQPAMEHVFIGQGEYMSAKNHGGSAQDKLEIDGLNFERKLYCLRKKIENAVRLSDLKEKSVFYITNLSSRTISFKGLLMPEQLEDFFLDLKDESIKSALCLVHSRYSTNTFPTWDLSQPFRFLAHNGEINTLRGNVNWMQAREGLLESGLFGHDLKKILPVIMPGGSDSASIDNVFELLVLAGRSLPHAMMMLIPSAWEQDNLMDERLKDFYKYHACLTEPWDGPAAIVFTDGTRVAAVLDRNGLRPCRYIITKKDLCVMASEVGVLDIAPFDILKSGRLEPGKIFFIDTEAGRIIDDQEIKNSISGQRPYGAWLKKNMLELSDLSTHKEKDKRSPNTLTSLKNFGYSREDLKVIIKPMGEFAQEPAGSMGCDSPHAVLSERPQLLYNYFKQLFAQVTNPAIDPIREELVMSLETYLGPERNILDETAGHCYKLRIRNPILTNEDLERIREVKKNGFKTKTISLLFRISARDSFRRALDRICKESVRAIKEGFTFIILSDRGTNRNYAALPSLLATAAVHHHLVKKVLRTQIGIVVESAEPREVHHFALLFGYGADCVNPYLVYQAVELLVRERELSLDLETATRNYIKAVDKGIAKIISKMGISTLQSYRGAQIFEALGLSQEVIDEYFSGTVSRIGGADLEVIAQEVILRHRQAHAQRGPDFPYLATGGVYQWKRDGEFHLWNPDTIATLQDATRNGDYKKYQEFACLINDQSKQPTTLRSLLKFKHTNPIPIEEVEPVGEIVKRFATGAMSFGSISKATHETIAIAMNRLKAKSNTGEGGEDPARFTRLPNGDSARSAIKQVASGRFGVTTNYLVNADELQIKIAQGAKPGEGGQLPGHKVSVVIARTRYTTPGVTLISPSPHHDIYSIEDLAQLIFDLKNTNPLARISVKLVSEIGVGTIAAGVAKGHADMILISGGDGGTGASPVSSIKHAGLPWELGLAETHQTLVLNSLRSRVRLQTDGQIRTGRDVAIAALLGAEEFGFSTAVLIVLGCVMLRHCHLNNCSVGIATQDDILEKRFNGKPEYVTNYFYFVAQELREIMSCLGIRRIDEMVGRADLLEVNSAILPWKAKALDFSKILYKPSLAKETPVYCTFRQEHGIDKVLDLTLIKLAQPALEESKAISKELTIANTNRATGAMLSGEVCRKYGEEGLPEDTIHFKFKGIAGQSFGAWLAKGVTFELEGMSNDYVGKGISGGKIIIYPDRNADYKPQENIIIGNTAFYGAISGEAYIRGVAGERFCIRNSGLNAVVGGVGDHGCEYMTGGRVVVLGKTGRNFAAGMSGGIAYIYDIDKNFKEKCNLEMVELEGLSVDDVRDVYNILRNHYQYTQSKVAGKILDNFAREIKKFIKVMPLEYKRVLEMEGLEEELGLAEVSDG
ncbi:MAG: glutamate synthase large subunit [Candidatus Omnitrophica bacterium CG08_land_8_20_14_0_20_41_16]|uniref:Glutamate synthase [NADPH] large chain n=1 Tax=Candidatus Sherwoodlollariibacterium unditelluris TaxID=1974757 RepID=A0A2G9YKW2_9BACT|nr:MAG: glutamate synthase large subunit [Candidatus Omnitrophica bacterium CG23_combo_of_CG06-09_8_20_14_all_41_10]PIS34012.1 MAG: glutamate synthase large subunit [Candidatus Omnitrophica bacterium CG08_land_8_20_14_0_20_41_16]